MTKTHAICGSSAEGELMGFTGQSKCICKESLFCFVRLSFLKTKWIDVTCLVWLVWWVDNLRPLRMRMSPSPVSSWASGSYRACWRPVMLKVTLFSAISTDSRQSVVAALKMSFHLRCILKRNASIRVYFRRKWWAQSNSRHDVPCLFICSNRQKAKRGLCVSCPFQIRAWIHLNGQGGEDSLI